MSNYSHLRSPTASTIRHPWQRQYRRRSAQLSRHFDRAKLMKSGAIGLGILSLWVWQWQLLLAIALASGVMMGLYCGDQLPIKQYLDQVYRLWQSRHQPFLRAVGGGLLTVLVSYGAIGIWQSSSNHWLISLTLVQSTMTATVLGLMMRRSWQQRSPQHQFEDSLADLGDPSTVRRLYATRQLRNLLQRRLLSVEQQQTLNSFVQLSWREESNPTLRSALLALLRLTHHHKSYAPSRPPLDLKKPAPIPIPLNQAQPIAQTLLTEKDY